MKIVTMAKIALIVGALAVVGSAGAIHLENGGTKLHHAAWKNDYLTATKLIAQGADIHAKNKDGRTPLHVAAWENADKIAALLIKNGADIHAKNKYGNTPLHHAAFMNADKIAALLIKNGADIHAKDEYGFTPLHDAAWKNSDKTAALLIENGADVNAKNNNGETPLNIARNNNQHKVADMLANLIIDGNNAGGSSPYTGGGSSNDACLKAIEKAVKQIPQSGGTCVIFLATRKAAREVKAMGVCPSEALDNQIEWANEGIREVGGC